MGDPGPSYKGRGFTVLLEILEKFAKNFLGKRRGIRAVFAPPYIGPGRVIYTAYRAERTGLPDHTVYSVSM
jgi:hypothetical protein